jgi:hypothetical protein
MRRFLIAIGLLLTPLQVLAADALSPWMQGVLDRTQSGLDTIAGIPGTADDSEVANELLNTLSLIRSDIDPTIAFFEASLPLRERTICFESDRLKLAAKFEEVRRAMDEATAAGRVNASMRLRYLYEFIGGAYVSFIRGSVDPTYQDDRLRYTYAFESQELLDDDDRTLNEQSDEPLCPYATDYGPRSVGYIPLPLEEGAEVGDPTFDVQSYGCDREVIEKIRDDLPASLQTEADDLLDFLASSTIVASDLSTLLNEAAAAIQATISTITTGNPTSSDPAPDIELTHGSVSGCLRPPSPEEGGRGDPADIDWILAAFPGYFDEANVRTDEGTGEQTYDPRVEDTFPVGMLLRPIVDYFTINPSAQIRVRQFSDRKGELGFDRPLPRDLQSTETNEMFSWLWNWISGTDYRKVSLETEKQSGGFEAVGRDSYERTLHAVEPLESAVKSLSKTVSPEGGVFPSYIVKLGYFLIRSCVDGHCQATLDSVLKRIFNPYCSPYVSGRYLDEEAAAKCFCDQTIAGEDTDFWNQYCVGTPETGEDFVAEPQPIICGEPPSSSSSSSSSASEESSEASSEG